MFSFKQVVLTGSVLLLAGSGFGQGLAPDIRAKVDSKVKQLQSWSTDAHFVAAVKAHNAGLTADEKAMTNDKWKTLTLLDPFVRGYSKNELGQYLKTKKSEEVAEIFVSGEDGTKVAFLSKTTSWTHKGKDKHQVPLTGKVWVGAVEVDESTGLQCVQVGLPVLDGGKPVGSIVVGLAVAKL
jgi:hypothetical protein